MYNCSVNGSRKGTLNWLSILFLERTSGMNENAEGPAVGSVGPAVGSVSCDHSMKRNESYSSCIYDLANYTMLLDLVQLQFVNDLHGLISPVSQGTPLPLVLLGKVRMIC